MPRPRINYETRFRAARIDYEGRFRAALVRIAHYDTPGALRRSAEKRFGLGYEEVLEMAYDNLREEAIAALKGYRRPRRTS